MKFSGRVKAWDKRQSVGFLGWFGCKT